MFWLKRVTDITDITAVGTIFGLELTMPLVYEVKISLGRDTKLDKYMGTGYLLYMYVFL